MTQARIVHVHIRMVAGMYVAESPDVQGFLVAHPDLAAVKDDVPKALRLLIRRRLNQDVIVTSLENAENQWVMVPMSVAQSQLGAQH